MSDNQLNPYESTSQNDFTTADAMQWNDATNEMVSTAIRMIRITTFALVMGLVSYGWVAVVQNQGRGNLPIDVRSRIIAATFATIGFAIGLVFEFSDFGLRSVQPVNKPNSGIHLRVAAACQRIRIRHIIKCAVLEGPAFFCIFKFTMNRDQLLLALAFILLVSMIALIPTRSRFVARIERLLAV